MMENLINNEPVAIWKYFSEICKIPRLSRKEEKITEYLIRFARKNKLAFRKDKAGNLLISKNASHGKGKTSPVLMQCHLDMVGEKELNSPHDFNKDPVIPRIKNGWVTASGTTLGADDGIGIAVMMALLEDKEIIHGPLECLFTVDEETGMTGASSLEEGFFTSHILLNLDSEDEGQLFIGCAGGIDTIARFRMKTKAPKVKSRTYHLKIFGLKGGHSGDEIHKIHTNAIQLVTRFLLNASREFRIQINRFEGGTLRNAIPREAEAIIGVQNDQVADFESYFQIFAGIVRKEVGRTEPGIKFVLKETSPAGSVLTRKLQERLLYSLYSCPHGVIGWSRDFEGLVETSTNLAMVRFDGKKEIVVTTSQRSSVESAKKDIADKVASAFTLANAKIERTAGYPGWAPNLDSEILKTVIRSYKSLFRKSPLVKTVHAGLECGLFLEKQPDLDMISFGPTIRGAHTPKEKISIRSTLKFWKLLIEVLKNIPEKQG